VFSRADNTTQAVPTVSPPEPIDYYNATDFFPIYDVAMNFTSTPVILDYITSVASQVNYGNVYDVQSLLRQFIAVPVGLYNEPASKGIYPPENQNVTGYLGIPAYQVLRFAFSLKLDCHLFCISLCIYIWRGSIPVMVNYCACGMCPHPIAKFFIISRNRFRFKMC